MIGGEENDKMYARIRERETAMGRKLSDDPTAAIMEREQRRLAKIGGRPCEWSAEDWARWSEGKD